MTLASLADLLKERLDEQTILGGTLKFVIPNEGSIFIDGNGEKNIVKLEDGPADCSIKIALKDVMALLSGDLQPAMAYMTGKIKVEGDMALAMHLSQLI